MNSINPYQSPRMETAAPPPAGLQAGRPTLLRCSLFGLYAGAVYGASAAGAGMTLSGLLLAAPLGGSAIALAVGGAYYGVIAGGFFGAVLGSPLAVAARVCRKKPGQWFAVLAVSLFALAFASLGGWLGMRLTAGPLHVPAGAVPGANGLVSAVAVALPLACGTLSGIAAGLLFARRIVRFSSLIR